MGSRLNRPNKATLAKLPEELLRHLYQDLDWADRAIAEHLGVKRDTVKKMRDFYGIPTTPKTKGILAWHAARDKEEVKAAARTNAVNRRANGTLVIRGRPNSWKPGHDNGKRGKTHEEFYGAERAHEISEKISATLKGRAAGEKNPMFGKPPMNKKNNHRGGYVESPAQGKVWMRSSWEIEYANYLTGQGVQWLYEPRCFDLGNGRTYRPDFYLPDVDEWHEVKGYSTALDKAKFALMESVHGIRIKVISWDEMRALNLRIRPAPAA